MVLDALEAAILAAAPALIDEAATYIAELARQKAPVRHIFEGEDELRVRVPRSVSDTQTVADLVTVGYVVRYPHRLKDRRRVPGGILAGSDELSRRGAYEVRSGRADYRPRGRPRQVGGKLKGQIHAIGAVIEGRQIRASVVSPTRYAKYQEYGTRHNAAHPYMRPAAAEARGPVTSQMAAGLAAAGREVAAQRGGRIAEIRVRVGLSVNRS